MALTAAGATAISAAASLLGSGANTLVAGKMNKKNRQFTEEQNAINRATSWDMWHATNNFNLETSSPAFQMQRYKQAGLNPWLIYGEPQKVSSSPVGIQQNGPIPQVGPDLKDIGTSAEKIFTALMQRKQMEAIDANIKKTDADTRVADATANLTEQKTSQDAQLFDGIFQGQALQNTGIGLDNDNKVAQNNKIIKDIELIGSQMQMNDQQIKNMKQNLAKGLVEIQNLQKQSRSIEAEAKAKELSNKLFENTMHSKAEAENATNNLIKNSGGMSKIGTGSLIPALIGGTLESIKKRYPNIIRP
jgi:hypothetical protein